MRIIGFNFTKIKVERLKEPSEVAATELKINTNIDISELKEIKSNILKTKEEIIGAKFVYGVDYSPDFAKVELEGKILVSADPKITKEVLKQWKKKKLPEDFNFLLFNVILKKCSLKALLLEEELNLPLHMPMPSLRKGEK